MKKRNEFGPASMVGKEIIEMWVARGQAYRANKHGQAIRSVLGKYDQLHVFYEEKGLTNLIITRVHTRSDPHSRIASSRKEQFNRSMLLYILNGEAWCVQPLARQIRFCNIR